MISLHDYSHSTKVLYSKDHKAVGVDKQHHQKPASIFAAAKFHLFCSIADIGMLMYVGILYHKIFLLDVVNLQLLMVHM